MSKLKNPFAYDENKNYIYIETKNYLKQEIYRSCYCPICNEKLIPKMGEKNMWHFSHSKDSNCENAFETSLHLYAKEVFKNNSQLKFPEINLHDALYMNMFKDKFLTEDILTWLYYNEFGTEQDTIIFKSNVYNYKWISNETKIDNFIPDIIIEINNKPVAIEIVVTHSVDKVKTEKVQKNNIDMLEIYLSPKDINEKMKEEKFDLDNYILLYADRKWINKTDNVKFDKEIMNKIYNTKKCVINEKYTQPILIERSKYFLICPMCNSKLVKKNGKNGEFYSCSNYPRCKFCKSKLYDLGCPKCGKKLYELEGPYGKYLGHILDTFKSNNCMFRRKIKSYEEFLFK